MKKIILAIDALEYELVKKFDCKNLKQEFFGKTDISEFSQPRTMVLWSSFLKEKNMEKEVLKLGDEKMWYFKVDKTFFSGKKVKIIDLPGFSYEKEQHEKERLLLKEFFEKEGKEAEEVKKEYNKNSFEHHKKIKKEFFSAIKQDFEVVIGYFSLADVIGHLNFGNTALMKMIYSDLDEIAKIAKEYGELLILSDHGMEAIGSFGDHSEQGFWSCKKDLGTPKITDFGKIINSS